MREYSEERSLLFALRERIAERPVLVTFNGKSFDWPLLETRYRMSRKISAPTPRAHLDFLHPARNLWRLRLGSVRLSELERHVLGWDRGADLLSGLIPQIYFDFLRGGPPSGSFQYSTTTRWTCAGWPHFRAGFFRCSAMPKTWGKTAWNCSVCPASAKSEGSTREPANFTRSRLRPFCQPKQIVQRAAHWHGWPSGKAISIWHASFGKMHSEIHGMAMRPMSSWRFTTNTRPVIQSKLDKSSVRHSLNFAAQFRWATSRPAPIANSKPDSIAEWSDWNERVEGRCWMAWSSQAQA